MILAGDIGGTKVNLALFDVSAGRLVLRATGTFASQRYASLEQLALEFSAAHKLPVTHAAFGVAGPVKHGRAQLTNVNWTVDATSLSSSLQATVWLLNDLEATAYGIAALEPQDFVVLNAGEPGATGNAAVIAAGTGLGEAGLFWDGQRHVPWACEGGHAEFAPRTDLDIELLKYLRARFGRVSWERVLSGPGLFNIYSFLKDTRRADEPAWLAEELSRGDPPAVISQAALACRAEICMKALDLFVAYYGAEASNLALKAMATAGVYIGGGIAPKVIAKLRDGTFMSAFNFGGRLTSLLEAIPVKVIMNEKTALLGAARFAALRAGLMK
ncbi:MAG: glucokinase [Verrucomicrobiae bacterium]|nr:glucokinase [Verrucomicrobiae bacterium]